MMKKITTYLFTLSTFVFFYSCNEQEETKHKTVIPEIEYRIAYNVLVDDQRDNYEVFSMQTDGNDKKNITNLSGVEWTYLSVKDKIYFISDKDTCERCFFLYRMDYDGKNVEQITNFQLRDSWMSSRNNGSELIVNPQTKLDSAFYIINTKGEILHKVYTGLTYFNDPTFSPDGKQIAFRGANKKFKKENGFIDEVYIMNEDGSNLRQLTHYPASDTSAKWYNYHAGPPMWNITENFISYQSFQNGKYSLYAVTPDGNKQWKLTENTNSEGWHCWSSDGKWLAIELFDKEQTQFHISLMNWETKELKVLTDTTYKYQQSPNFVEVGK
jgi:TolB protein